MTDISYRIISYDPQAIGLARTTKKTVIDFLRLIGRRLTPTTIECHGCGGLERVWDKLGTYRDGDDQFKNKLFSIHDKATIKLPSYRGAKNAILVTSKSIGKWVGVCFDWTLIISSYQINNDLDTVATAVFHELGHMHKIPCLKRREISIPKNDCQIVEMEKKSENRDAIYDCFYKHCLNPGCSMRQRLDFENWKNHLTVERLHTGKPYCERCLNDLKSGRMHEFGGHLT